MVHQIDTVKCVHEAFYRHCLYENLQQLEYYTNPGWEKSRRVILDAVGRRENSGFEILKKLNEQLDAFGYERSEMQRDAHDIIDVSCARKIFEKEWQTQYEAIMEFLGIDEVKIGLIMVCPRRFGKTWAVAMYCAAHLRWVPNCEIAVFAQGQRMSGKLMMATLQFLLKIPGIEDYITKKNNETVELTFGPNDVRKICCYPSSSQVCFCCYRRRRRRHHFHLR